MNNLGAYIKELREKENCPQRKLAHELDLDVSVLSKIENENRFPKKRVPQIIKVVSKLFDVPAEDLKQDYLSDEIASLLISESNFQNILRVSEAKVKYVRIKKKSKKKS